MKKLVTLVLLVAAIFLLPRATKGQTTFQKTFGNATGYCVKQTNDGNIIITGSPMFLIKMDQGGNVLWYKQYSSVTGGTDGNSVQQTSDGGYIICGTHNTGPMSKLALVKVDSNGNFQWSKTFGGSMYEEGYDVKQTPEGDYIAVGITRSFGTPVDMYLVKTDSNGNLLWSVVDNGILSQASSIAITKDSNYVVTGMGPGLSAADGNVFLTKISKNGSAMWSKSYGGTNGEMGESIIATKDGGYSIAGWTQSFGASGCDNYVLKTDSAGTLLWSKNFGAVGGVVCERSYCISETSFGNFIVAGTCDDNSASNSARDILLTEINSNGDSLWTRVYGDNSSQGDAAFSTVKSGSSIFSVGYSNGFGGMYLIKTDSIGNSGCNQSNRAIAFTTASTVESIIYVVTTSVSTVVNTASFTVSNVNLVNTLCFDSGVPPVVAFTGTNISPCSGQTASFSDQSLNNPISLKWIFQGGNPATSTQANPIVTYSASGTYDVTLIATNTHGSDTLKKSGYVIVDSCLGVSNIDISRFIKVGPNPFTASTVLRIDGFNDFGEAKIEIFDMFGKRAAEFIANQFPFTIPRGDLQSGMYFYSVSGNGLIGTGKIIVQ